MKLLSALFLVSILCAAPRRASAQAATEYGLAAGSSATSVSGVGTMLNRKLDQATSGKTSHGGTTTIVHTTRPSASNVRSANTKTGQGATASNRGPKQASADAAHKVPPGGFTIVGGEPGSGGSTVAKSSS